MSLLEVTHISVDFGGIKAVDNISFAVQPGEVFTLIGPNGAGKTTVFNLISRIYNATSGSITYHGKGTSVVLNQIHPHRIAALGIARTFQNIELFENASVLHNLLIGYHTHCRTKVWQDLLFLASTKKQELVARRKIEEIIDFLNLQHYRDHHVGGLPYGVRKVVELGRALACQPKLLLLDEPSSGLNVEETEDMVYWIKDIQKILGITVLMVEHDMSLVGRVSDRVLAMNQGQQLICGTLSDVQKHPGVLQAYMGIDPQSTPPPNAN